MAWAFAIADQADVLLFTALACESEQRTGELNAENLAKHGLGICNGGPGGGATVHGIGM